MAGLWALQVMGHSTYLSVELVAPASRSMGTQLSCMTQATTLLIIHVNYAHVLFTDVMRYDEMEFDEESEPEVPIYNRAELIERYQVMIRSLSFQVLLTLFI